MDVFLVADHLLKCLDLLLSLEDKSSFYELMVDAGNEGRQSGAHDMALSYYKAAIQLSDPERNGMMTIILLLCSSIQIRWLLLFNWDTMKWSKSRQRSFPSMPRHLSIAKRCTLSSPVIT